MPQPGTALVRPPLERPTVRGCVDADSQAAHHGDTLLGELSGEALR
jgi:hypothetical protein